MTPSTISVRPAHVNTSIESNMDYSKIIIRFKLFRAFPLLQIGACVVCQTVGMFVKHKTLEATAKFENHRKLEHTVRTMIDYMINNYINVTLVQ